MSRRSAPVSRDDLVEVTIDRLAQGGRGVARHENFVLFVQRGMPGDRVRARVTRVKRSFAEARVEEILERGSESIVPPCTYAGTCGGCAWQGLDYPAQLRAKEASVRELLERVAGLEDPPLHPILGATSTLGYRNKVEYTFCEREDGSVGAGFHVAGHWDKLVHVDPCLIADPRGLPAHRVVLDWANRHGVLPYDREFSHGHLRSLVVRVGHATGEVMVHLVTSLGKIPKLAEVVDDLAAEVPGLVSVMHSQTDSVAEVAMGDEPPVCLWGRDHYFEELGGNRLAVGALSFMQTNTAMAERLYELTMEVAQPRSDDVMYDLYCGLGSIALMFAPHVDNVIGVEVIPEAIEDANANAERAGITNAEFQHGNVRPVLKFARGVWPDPTLIVVDPPRSGLVEKVVRRVCAPRPERIVYVSCNPSTFAANVPQFAMYGYQPVFIQPVDQFPHNHHVELVARFEPIPDWVAPDDLPVDPPVRRNEP